MDQLRLRARMLLLASSLVGLAGMATAQSDAERAGARAAAEQGVRAYSEGRWAQAIDLMTRAEKLVHAPTHLLFVAQAEEKLGHLVIAHETYLRIAREKLRPDAPEAFVAAQETAKRSVDALRPRLSQVTITLQGASGQAGVEVLMDGEIVPEALLGVPHPVDPGGHEFRAKGSAVSSTPVSVQLREGAAEAVVLVLEGTAAATPTNVSPRGQTTGGSEAGTGREPASEGNDRRAPTASSKREEVPSSSMRLFGYGSLGLGAVGVGLGTVFLVQSLGKRSDANALCSLANSGCPESKKDEVNQLDADANRAGNLATVGFAVGGVALAAGATLLVLSPSSSLPRDSKRAQVVPYLGVTGAGVVGSF